VALAEQQGYDVEVKSQGPRWAWASDSRMSPSHASSAGASHAHHHPGARVGWSLLGALAGRKTYQVRQRIRGDVDVESAAARPRGASRIGHGHRSIRAPVVKAAINLPLFGTLEMKLDEKMPAAPLPQWVH